jgi:predicted transcriptional regulator
MVNMEEAIEDIEFLASSRTRVRILDLLSQHKELDKQELRDQIDASRTTVQRNLDTLVDQGWIQNTNRTYEIDTCGDLVAEKFLELTETIEIERRLQPFLKWVDRPEFDLDLHLLADAELLVAEPGDPWSMINRQVQLIRETDNGGIGFLPFTGLHACEVTHNQILNHDASYELVVMPKIADTHFSDPAYGNLFTEMIDSGRLNYFVYEGDLPYSLVIIDGTIQIIVADGDEPRAMLETDSEEVREWAEEKYESYKQRSEPVSI